MRNKTKTWTIVAAVAGFLLLGSMGYAIFRMSSENDALSENLSRVENRNRMLDQKYKEKKAEVGRLQRESLGLKGKIRQAIMDYEKLEAEHKHLLESKTDNAAKFKAKAEACEAERKQLSAEHRNLEEKYAELTNTHKTTTKKLKKREAEFRNLTSEMQAVKVDLERTTQQSRRYRKHNKKLAKVAKTLVARVEKQELGTAVLTSEPLIQFKRVEVEKLLQEYLDIVDESKIIH